MRHCFVMSTPFKMTIIPCTDVADSSLHGLDPNFLSFGYRAEMQNLSSLSLIQKSRSFKCHSGIHLIVLKQIAQAISMKLWFKFSGDKTQCERCSYECHQLSLCEIGLCNVVARTFWLTGLNLLRTIFRPTTVHSQDINKQR